MKFKNILITVVFAVFIFLFSLICFLKPSQEYSLSERRPLKTLPEISAETILSGEFMDEFEGYTADQFPFRDKFRSIKAVFSTKVLRKLDNNGLFLADGHISKIDEAENEHMLNHAAERFEYITKTFITNKNANLYFCIVPDKNFILAPKNGYPSLDYDSFTNKMKEKLPYMKYHPSMHHI